MSSVASPFGLKPAQPLSGTLRQREGTIVSAQSGNIFQYDPVGINAAGFLVTVSPTTVITTGAIVGAFMGVEFTAVDGRRRVDNRWVGGTIGTDIVAYFSLSLDIVYEMQAVGSLVQADVGDLFNPSAAGGGNATTGLSSVSAVSASDGSLRLIGINPASDNVVGDAFTIGQFIINKHQYAAVSANLA